MKYGFADDTVGVAFADDTVGVAFRQVLINVDYTDADSGLSMICEIQLNLDLYCEVKHLIHRFCKDPDARPGTALRSSNFPSAALYHPPSRTRCSIHSMHYLRLGSHATEAALSPSTLISQTHWGGAKPTYRCGWSSSPRRLPW